MKIGDILSNLWSLIFGGSGGGVVAAVDDGLKLANTVATSIHDNNEQASGAAKALNQVQEKTLETVQKVADARADPGNMQRVRNESVSDQ